jgi:tRNA-binding EMAP/Myf-like protein
MMSEGMLLHASPKQKETSYSLNDKPPEAFHNPADEELIEKSHIQEN